jgi:hypothetical protein
MTRVPAFLALLLVCTGIAQTTITAANAGAEERRVRMPAVPSCSPLARITASEYYGLRNLIQLLLLKKRRLFELQSYIEHKIQPRDDPEEAAAWNTTR